MLVGWGVAATCTFDCFLVRARTRGDQSSCRVVAFCLRLGVGLVPHRTWYNLPPCCFSGQTSRAIALSWLSTSVRPVGRARYVVGLLCFCWCHGNLSSFYRPWCRRCRCRFCCCCRCRRGSSRQCCLGNALRIKQSTTAALSSCGATLR